MLAHVVAAAVAAAGPAGAERPPIVHSPIPFGPARRAQMRRYAQRHYGLRTMRLRRPRTIVQHLTANRSYRATWNTFARNVPDPELHELPGTCAHFVVDRDGTIHQLVSLSLMCRHTVGLNWTAVGVEHVAMIDSEAMGNRRQLRASVRLTKWLQARFAIPVRDVIGHNESLRSRWHRERVARLRRQTHGDFRPATMVRYRRLLR